MCAEHIWLRAWAGCRRSCRFNADTMQRTAHGLLSATLCRPPPPFSYVPSRHSLCLLHVLALARSLSSFALGRSIWFLEILWMPSMLITHQSHLPPSTQLTPFLFFMLATCSGHVMVMPNGWWWRLWRWQREIASATWLKMQIKRPRRRISIDFHWRLCACQFPREAAESERGGIGGASHLGCCNVLALLANLMLAHSSRSSEVIACIWELSAKIASLFKVLKSR